MQDSNAIRAAVRRRLKKQRRELSSAERITRAKCIAASLRRARVIGRGQRIALYSATDGEVPLDEIARWARRLRCELYLPRIVNWTERRMRFVRWNEDTPLRRHRFGMVEPVCGAVVSTRELDLVLLPAVAIDRRGVRLGMGAGFYDRSFAHRRLTRWRRPRLIAVVYDFQRIPELPSHALDVPVDAVVSETGLQRFSTEK
ncbi:MAG: 5-formyltetrahydrofolate cyclo-ligase [Steroidobacteraceae bacterium]